MEQENNTKNLLLALVLSIVILTLWQFLYTIPEEERYKSEMEAYQKQQQLITQKKEKAAQQAQQLAQELQVTEVPEKRISISTPTLHGSLTTKGARIDSLTLSHYHVENDPASDPVTLLAPNNDKNTNEFYLAEFGWVSKDKALNLPNHNTVWQTSQTQLTPSTPVDLTWQNGQGLTFTLTVSVDENYMFAVTKSVTNQAGHSVTLSDYGTINRSWTPEHLQAHQERANYIIHTGGIGVFDGILQEFTYQDMSEQKSISFKHTTGWLGFSDKYWLTALIPSSTNTFFANYKYYFHNLRHRYQTDYSSSPYVVANNDTYQTTTHFFAGAKKISLLDNYAQELNIDLFDRAVDFGWLYFITKPMLIMLKFFYDWIGNFGFAILLLTVLIKALLFPLAHKSYVSMHQMKMFTPQLQEIRERYKDDKMQMHQHTMALYKREKINPASGCLPILLQIPVFFALYKVLFVTIEMRHAPFFGWITDLSAQDPTSIFNLFGLIPWEVGPVLQIGVWPVLMGLTMYLQQKMNPEPADPIQAKVFKLLPFFFTLILYRFPAGLVIYWAWNNTLTVLQQWYITKTYKKRTASSASSQS